MLCDRLMPDQLGIVLDGTELIQRDWFGDRTFAVVRLRDSADHGNASEGAGRPDMAWPAKALVRHRQPLIPARRVVRRLGKAAKPCPARHYFIADRNWGPVPGQLSFWRARTDLDQRQI
jgi:hypothetical protein